MNMKKRAKTSAGGAPARSTKLRIAAGAAVLAALGACGGGGGSAPAVVQPPPTVLGVTSPMASQAAAAGEAALAFEVALDAAVAFPVTVSFSTSAGAGAPVAGAACTGGVDYYVPGVANLTVAVSGNSASGTLTIPDAASSRQVTARVCPTNSATNKVINFSWSGGNGSGTATATILGAASADLAGSDRLNDTGITACSNAAANGLACPQGDFPNQDAEAGRDVNPAITGTGANRTSAFALTALNGGAVIQDNVTGLVWQGKTTDGGLHDANATFTWFNSNNATNGGGAGTANGGVCAGAANCDTEKYVAAVNAAALGGFTDWRLPTAQELQTLVDSGAAAGPTVDAAVTNHSAAQYWTASPRANDPTGAWVVDFTSGAVAFANKSVAKRVRLVRGR